MAKLLCDKPTHCNTEFLVESKKAAVVFSQKAPNCLSIGQRRNTMIKYFSLGLFLIFYAPLSWADQDIQRIIEKGGTAKFKCSYKKHEADGYCEVISKAEFITHDFVKQFYGESKKIQGYTLNTITIKWPTGKVSKFAWTDSSELLNLDAVEPANGYAPAFSEWPEIDWSHGFIIKQYDKELIRVW